MPIIILVLGAFGPAQALGREMDNQDKTSEQRLSELGDLRRSARFFRSLIENALDIVQVVDADGTFLYVSPSVERVLGYKPEEIVGRNVFDFIHPEDLPGTVEAFARVVEDPTNSGYRELRVRHKDGTLRVLEGVPVNFLDDPDVSGIVISARDITERKRAEDALQKAHAELEAQVEKRTAELAEVNTALRAETAGHVQVEMALRASEARYRAVVEDQTDMINRYTTDGTIVYANEAYASFRDRRLDELIGQNLKDILSKEAYEGLRSILARLSPDSPVGTTEVRTVKPNGDVCWISWTDRLIVDNQGRPVEYQGVGRDVTERRQAEEALKTLLREKEVLLKEVHHRVKNNLQTVSALLNLQSQYSQDPRLQQAFQESQNRVRSMARVHELLYGSPDLALIDMADYVGGLTGYLRRAYGAYAVALRTDIPNVALDINAAIPCGLIVNELVSNALKHAFPEGREGRVSIELRSRDDDRFTLTVSDNGVGLPSDLDLQNPVSLGLHLVNVLTDQLDGTLEVDRTSGTAFKITFPA